MKSTWYHLPLTPLIILSGFLGCDLGPGKEPDNQQAAIGMGIVVGTQGFQEIQEELAHPDAYAQTVEVQVTKIEGAAYLAKDSAGNVMRLPLDENTTIDRPAHVGDWIEAFLDARGRTVFIRNIDE